MIGSFASATPVASGIPFDNSSNGFVSTNLQAALEESYDLFSVINAVSTTATSNTTTSSSADALLNSMTLTPDAGTYLVFFSSSITIDMVGGVVSWSMYVDGAQQAATLLKHSVFDGGALSAVSGRSGTNLTSTSTVNGSQAIEIRWSTSGGTATCGPRTLLLLRLS